MIYKKFSSGVRWSLFGGIFYESTKIAHQALLLTILSLTSYGKMGIIFSVIYLIMNLINAGAITTIAPFLSTFKKNKETFKRLFGIYFSLQALLLSVGSLILYRYADHLLLSPEISIYIPMTLIISEGLRTLLRAFLHTIFLHKRIVLIESILNIAYLTMVWGPYLMGYKMTLGLIFKPHLVISIVALGIFLSQTRSFYLDLPNEKTQLPKGLLKRMAKARFFNGITRLTRHVFTGNLLVPLFAHRFGLAEAGIFKFASYLSDSIKAILNTTIGFTGGALLADLKEASLAKKREAFYIISEKLNKAIYFILIFLAINTKTLLGLNHAIYDPHTVITFALFFLFAAIMEKLFIVYDQFYIVEELSDKLFVFKLLELILFYIAIVPKYSPTITLLNLILVRMLTFGIIATSAIRRWKIKPHFKVNLGFIIYSFIISSILRLALK